MHAETKPEVAEQTVRAVVTRADGTVEDLGVISYYSKNKWTMKALFWRLKKRLKELLT